MTDAAPSPSHPGGPQDVHNAVAEITELAGGLAHELRNPLSTMMIQLDLLAEDLRDPSVDEVDVRRRGLLKLDILRREAKRLQALFDEFLTLTGPCRLNGKRVDLNEIVKAMVDFFRPQAHSAGIELSSDLTDEPVFCVVDEGMIRQALLNIVINAQQAMPGGGSLQLSVGLDSPWGRILVADSGLGIAEADRDKILRPFFSTKSYGSGLGLSITRRIVVEHGGSLSFESSEGGGARFEIRLPLAGEASEDASTAC